MSSLPGEVVVTPAVPTEASPSDPAPAVAPVDPDPAPDAQAAPEEAAPEAKAAEPAPQAGPAVTLQEAEPAPAAGEAEAAPGASEAYLQQFEDAKVVVAPGPRRKQPASPKAAAPAAAAPQQETGVELAAITPQEAKQPDLDGANSQEEEKTKDGASPQEEEKTKEGFLCFSKGPKKPVPMVSFAALFRYVSAGAGLD